MSPEQWSQVKQIVAAASDLPAGERAPYLEQACPNPDLRREAESLVLRLAEPGLLDSRDRTLPPSLFPHLQPMTGRHVGPYQVVREIGHGGMGSVYLAVRADDQYVKLAAVKLLRTGLDSNFFLKRFRNERQILAGLEHPNIARLLDGGALDDGIPYLVMEYVEGEPLDVYCDSRQLSIPSRLELFHGVCLAVQHAHQHLVVHRDIKPGNILVTPDGIPKLLDFGIAKIMGSDAPDEGPPATLGTLRMMTPEYASPEQFRGTAMTTSTDVYSLGVVLYELLTGRRPYRLASRDPLEVARAISEQEPERPSAAVNRDNHAGDEGKFVVASHIRLSAVRDTQPRKLTRILRGDLDAIVLKALRKEIQNRYATVGELSADLRSYLEGKPVLARRGTRAYYARKFIRRRRWGVGIAAACLLLGTAGVAAIVREARIARTQQARAERRFNDLRKLANSLLFEVNDAIQDLPGSTTARKLLVQNAVAYFDSLAKESGGDPGLQRELAEAYERLARVEGYQYRANLGDTVGAQRSFEKALKIRERLYAASTGPSENAIALARTYRLLATTRMENGDVEDATADSQHAGLMGERLQIEYPNDISALDEALRDYEALAAIQPLANPGDIFRGVTLSSKMLDLAERIAKLAPQDPRALRGVAFATSDLGSHLALTGDRHAALERYLQAQQIFEQLASRAPNSNIALHDLADCYYLLEYIRVSNGEFHAARKLTKRMMEIDQALFRADPSDALARSNLANAYLDLGDIESRLERDREALSAFSAAAGFTAKLVADNPQNSDFRGLQGNAEVTIGEAYERAGNWSEALRRYREALGIYSKLAADEPENLDVKLCSAAALNKLASATLQQGNVDDAEASFQKVLGAASPFASPEHLNAQADYTIADAYTGLGDVEASRASRMRASRGERTVHWNKALASYQNSLVMWSEVKDPGLVSPDGFDATGPKAVRQRISKCNAALRRMSDLRSP